MATKQVRPMFGTHGALAKVDDKLQCHVCGRAFHHLGAHVKRTHDMEADDYRELFGLNYGTGLISEALAAKRRLVGQLVSLKGSTAMTNTSRGIRRKRRAEGVRNRALVRDPRTGRIVG